ncbi:MAG: tRNA (adenine(22)-N(1))-methyltransferase TrmK [Candidatus Dormibacteria bacterium]
MSNPPLPARLRVLPALVPTCARRLVDIGAGHGALSVHLRARADVVIATDVADGPPDELHRNMDRWGADAIIDVRRGAGFTPIDDGEVDAAVIAGMGAERALSIASDAPAKRVRWLLLQCMQRPHLVEPWVAARRWTVHDRVEITQRRHTYQTWLVEVAA